MTSFTLIYSQVSEKSPVFFSSVPKILKPWFQLDLLDTGVTQTINYTAEANMQANI